MTITKFGHSCFLLEENGARFLFDPGTFSKGQNDLTDLDAMLITHDHADHLDIESVKVLVAKNPDMQIIGTEAVQGVLQKEGITSSVLAQGDSMEVKGLTIEAIGKDHAVLVNSMPPAQNVGFMIAGRLFFPGDALTLPGREVEILALPAAAPWSKLSEVVDYALAVKPKIAFPVHEAILAHPQMMFGIMEKTFSENGIEWRVPELHTPTEF
jgi:L-ascorbate metabolism protein UlaG (beta-lactamase superfamily)